MSGPDFFRTRMGARFYEGTMPKIAEQIERLNDILEALLVELRKLQGRATPAATWVAGSSSRATGRLQGVAVH